MNEKENGSLTATIVLWMLDGLWDCAVVKYYTMKSTLGFKSVDIDVAKSDANNVSEPNLILTMHFMWMGLIQRLMTEFIPFWG